jgi:hypothetical protein
MPIKAACQKCGQSFNARDELAGKTVKCPKCGGALKVPAPASGGLVDLLEEVGLKENAHNCPACGVEIAPEAVLCVHCGFDMRKGHRLQSRVGAVHELDEDEYAELPTHGNPMLDKAEREIARDKLEQERLDKGVPWWMIFLALVGLVGFAVGMLKMDQDRVVETSAYVLIGAGGLLAAFFLLRIIMAVFQRQWERVSGFAIFLAAGGVMVGAGFLLRYFAPMMVGGGGE